MQTSIAKDQPVPDEPSGDGRAPYAPKKKEERAMAVCEAVIDLSAALFNVSGRELRRPGRTAADISRVRQVAMYVTHVLLGLSMGDVGRGFGRDRTTVLHACHLIEDLRDDEEFDRLVTMTERVVAAAFGLARAGP